jgi:hypothetical protein
VKSVRVFYFYVLPRANLLMMQALIHSDSARPGALEHHRSIKLSTYSIIFMRTPHQGVSGVALGRLLVNIASVFVPTDDRLLRHLKRDSEWLQQQLGQYGPISSEFVTKFAYEEYLTPTVLGHSIMVSCGICWYVVYAKANRLCHEHRPLFQGPQMQSQSLCMQITSIWSNSGLDRMKGIRSY